MTRLRKNRKGWRRRRKSTKRKKIYTDSRISKQQKRQWDTTPTGETSSPLGKWGREKRVRVMFVGVAEVISYTCRGPQHTWRSWKQTGREWRPTCVAEPRASFRRHLCFWVYRYNFEGINSSSRVTRPQELKYPLLWVMENLRSLNMKRLRIYGDAWVPCRWPLYIMWRKWHTTAFFRPATTPLSPPSCPCFLLLLLLLPPLPPAGWTVAGESVVCPL